MFLVIHHIDQGEDPCPFFWGDPRPEGCTLSVVEGVEHQGLTSEGKIDSR